MTTLTFQVESIVNGRFLSMTQNLSWLHRGVAETFFRLFEEYPQSLAFFGYLGTTSMEELRLI